MSKEAKNERALVTAIRTIRGGWIDVEAVGGDRTLIKIVAGDSGELAAISLSPSDLRALIGGLETAARMQGAA